MTPCLRPVSRSRLRGTARLLDERGQSLIEGAVVLPLLMVVAFGVVEVGSAIRDDQVVTRLSREGSNLISRGTTLEDAAAAMAAMSGEPLDFRSNAKVIFTVLKRGGTISSANYGQLALYQRLEYGVGVGSSRLGGTGTFGPAPDYIAINSEDDTGLQVGNAPAGVASVIGGIVYVTEIIVDRTPITPVARFGINVPLELYSIAYFCGLAN